ncbi:exonuclease SbcCD subunit D [Schlesneria sp. T3-172]|uniref:metallophosphoesterase family protein n=1 Tax=Schlesneria sphaerica TaxID=3373610 RepID=UPI0037C8B085
MTKPLRLIHAANLQLDCPLRGPGTLNEDVREIVELATITAFDRIIAKCLEKDVEGLLITGNTFDAGYPSLAAEVALREGFTRLAERQIPVFVTPGRMDPATAWQEIPTLPENVNLLLEPREAPVELIDKGRLLALLLPVTPETSIEPEELTRLLGDRGDPQSGRPLVVGMLISDRSTDRRDRPRPSTTRFAALDCLLCPAGTDTESLPLIDGHVLAQAAPQGMSASETGIRGVTLLEVDGQKKTKQIAIPTAPVRWESLVQLVDHVNSRDDLLERMVAQLERLPLIEGENVRIIDWKLDRESGDARGWETDAMAADLASALTELTDQYEGLRYVHRVRPLELDLTIIEPAHREVLTEYLLALERRAPANPQAFSRWITEARVEEVLKSTRWEEWAEAIPTEQVTQLAQQLGWKWCSNIGKK